MPNVAIKDKLGLSGRVVGDFVKLAQKHPEYFSHPQEVKVLSDFIFEYAKEAMLATDKRFALLIAPLEDTNTNFGSAVIRLHKIGRASCRERV